MRPPLANARMSRMAVFGTALLGAIVAFAASGAMAWGVPELRSSELSSVYVAVAIPGDMYVETPANGGSDTTGDGTPATPYATVAKAMSVITGVHTIHVGPGEFECVELSVKNNVSIEGVGASETTLTANHKGRVLLYNDTLTGETLSKVTITGGDGVSKGGGLYMSNGAPTIMSCVITGNSALSSGGGMWLQYSASPYVVDTVISNNSADFNGGAVYAAFNCVPRFLNCTLSSNRGISGKGGAVFSMGTSRLEFTSCDITSNHSGDAGGGMFLRGVLTTITACTITNNTAAAGSAGIGADYAGETTVTCSVVWGNGPGGPQLNGSGFSATYSDIGGGYAGAGNIDADPLFRGAGDYRLSGGSPAIDTADPLRVPGIDRDGIIRPQGVGVDMGAHEYVFTPRTARGDSMITSESLPATCNVLLNDDPSESSLTRRTAVRFSAPSSGVLETAASGDVTYTPPANWGGTATFTYVADYETTTSAPATVTITVLPPTAAPVALDDEATSPEDTVATLNVLANDTDVDTPHESLVATAFSVPTTGTLETLPSGEVTYTPPADWNGVATFTYRTSDGLKTSNVANVVIVVSPRGEIPRAVHDERMCLEGGSDSFNVLTNDTDPDTAHGSLIATAFTQPAFGTLVTRPSGDVTYTAPAFFLGATTFTYRVTDGEFTSEPMTVTITVGRRTITRVGGADRYEAAANFARRGWDPDGTNSWTGVEHVIIANGEPTKEADPLCASGLAGLYDAPILLIRARSIPSYTRAALTEIAAANPGVRIHIVGGTGSVPDDRWREIKKITGIDPTYDRIGGADRYAVSAGIASRIVWVKGANAVPGAILVAADNLNAFYDGLAAGPISFATGMPLVAVRKDSVPPASLDVLGTSLKGKPRFAASSVAYIGAVPGAEAERLTSSDDRYLAASQIASSAIEHDWLVASEVGVAAKLPDALTGGAFLGRHGFALLFTDSGNTMQPATAEFLSAHNGQTRWGWVLGGSGSVPDSQMDTFEGLLK